MVQRISVVIPTNRGGDYLAEAVASVEAQTSPVDEIVLVDDGSPDPGLAHVAARLGVRYVRQDASGLSVARNTGVAAAAFEWVAFLDDDDVWHPERISAQRAAVDAAPDVVACCTGGWYIDADGVPFGDGWSAPRATTAEMISAAAPPPRIPTLLIRRDAYECVGGCDPRMEPSEDNDLILRLLEHGRFACVDRQLVGYRRHRGNVTHRGLAGRRAGRRVIAARITAARAAGDRDLVRLLRARRGVFLRESAWQNLTELIDAVKARDLRYAARTAGWAAIHAPAQSLRAIGVRLSERRERRRAQPRRAR